MGNRRTWLGVLVAFVVIGSFCGILIWRGVSNRDVQYTSCTQIELVKTELRKEARENFKDLDKNGALLGIKITPALRDAARADRDKTLLRFAPINCKHLVT